MAFAHYNKITLDHQGLPAGNRGSNAGLCCRPKAKAKCWSTIKITQILIHCIFSQSVSGVTADADEPLAVDKKVFWEAVQVRCRAYCIVTDVVRMTSCSRTTGCEPQLASYSGTTSPPETRRLCTLRLTTTWLVIALCTTLGSSSRGSWSRSMLMQHCVIKFVISLH